MSSTKRRQSGSRTTPSKRQRNSSNNTSRSSPAASMDGTGTPGQDYPSDLEAAEYSLDDQESGDEIFQHQPRRPQKVKLRIKSKDGTVTGSNLTHIFGKHDFTELLELKSDHENRPLWINPEDGRIILEGFSPLAEQAEDFLVAIAEPVSRPSHIHEYKLTTYSLYAAVSVGLKTKDIIDVLDRLSKVPLSSSIVKFIEACTVSYGKVKLVLKQNRYFVESPQAETLQMLLKDPIIGPLRIETESNDGALTRESAPRMGELRIPGTVPKEKPAEGETMVPTEGEDFFAPVLGVDREDDDDISDAVHSFEIDVDSIETVKKRCRDLEYPMLEEYDFRNDTTNPNLEIDLKPATQIRPYQEKSLSKMFGNGRARSGIIVLPCGAGKTLVGITAACTIKKSIMVLCTSSVSVMQWRQQFLQWSNIKPESIAVFTADSKERFKGPAGIVVSTYSMVANTRQRAHDAAKMMDFITSREWGFIILDEVHVVPAAIFRRVVTTIAAHAKLGLTATLVREDDKIDDLNFLIGPKLYEANWMDLAKKGHIANVQCAEVWCAMTPEFYNEYLRETSRKRMLLYIMNPNKFQACQFLIDYHEKRGDKIIVFSDNVYALQMYAKYLKRAFIYGATPQQERMSILENFRYNELVNTIFLSSVGDTSIDLPEATCLIQISSHYGSRRQEAQRLGRILRAKRRNDEGFNAFFYSLVSKDTQEMFYSTKRQAFLVDQGYAFKVITELKGLDTFPGLAYKSAHEQRELLQNVLLQNADAANMDVYGDDYEDRKGTPGVSRAGTPKVGGTGGGTGGGSKAKRSSGSLASLAGGEGMAYQETNKNVNKTLKKDHHPLFKSLYKKR